MTPMELTGHESGIICYGENKVAVVNWSSCGETQIPLLDPFGLGMINFPEGENIYDGAEARRVDDVRAELPGTVWLTGDTAEDGTRIADTDMDIVWDASGDILTLLLDDTLTADDLRGTVYALKDGRKLIVPCNWA